MSDKVVQITDPATNKTAALPVVSGTRGDPAFDIGKLNRETGYFTYDPGFMSTASTRRPASATWKACARRWKRWKSTSTAGRCG